MDRTTSEWVDGRALHLRLTERSRERRRRADWSDGRDLGLVATCAALAPLAVFALEVGASHALIGGLMAAAATLALLAHLALRREYALEPLSLATAAAGAANRWGRAPLRVVPALHARDRPRARAALTGRPHPRP